MSSNQLIEFLGIPSLPKYLKQVDDLIYGLLTESNVRIRVPALRVVRGGGKRLRPALVIASAIASGKAVNESVIAGAAAVELVHLGSIVHDDIMDDSEIRWSKSTVNASDGVSTAILVGDYFLALASLQAASVNETVADTVARVITTMCNGQSQEFNDKNNTSRSIKSYFDTIEQKTASLFSAACAIGGLSVGLSRQQISKLSEFGKAFGMAFQLIDDLLDLVATTETFGKPIGIDLENGIYTLAVLYGLQGPKKNQIKAWTTNFKGNKQVLTKLIETLTKDKSIQKTINQIQSYNSKSAELIIKHGEVDIVSKLSTLSDKYLLATLNKNSPKFANLYL